MKTGKTIVAQSNVENDLAEILERLKKSNMEINSNYKVQIGKQKNITFRTKERPINYGRFHG